MAASPEQEMARRVLALEEQVKELRGLVDIELPSLKRSISSCARTLERIGDRNGSLTHERGIYGGAT